MSKVISDDQARQMIASFAVDTPWAEVEADIQQFLDLTPFERGARFAAFLRVFSYPSPEPGFSPPENETSSANESEGVSASTLPAETTRGVFDSIIRVDRMTSPNYPSWVRKSINLALELEGPREFDIKALKEWSPYTSCDGIKYVDVYGRIAKSGILRDCLGLLDLEAIRMRGGEFIRQNFGERPVVGWKALVLHNQGGMEVPCLFPNAPEIKWIALGSKCISEVPVYHFES